MTRRRDPAEDRAEAEDARSDAFRCPGCEVNNGTGRYCAACLAEYDQEEC